MHWKFIVYFRIVCVVCIAFYVGASNKRLQSQPFKQEILQYQKSDSIKAAQLVAYKNYFSTQFGMPKDNIDVEFFIVKRKMIEESMFPQKRIQQFKPAAGTVTQRKVQKQIDSFVESCFDLEGNKNAERPYLAISGKGDKNCKYCPFKTDYVNCPKENRIRE
jgi:hypothetical protein